MQRIDAIRLFCCSWLASFIWAAPDAKAASISFRGAFEVSSGNEPIQTLDWHFFRVGGESPIVYIEALVEAANFNTAWMLIGAYDGSDFLSDTTLVEPSCGEASCFSHEVNLSAGVWAVGFIPQAAARDPSYLGDPTWPEFQFNWGGYFLSISSFGQAEGLEWVERREGNLDNTFTITRIPEPQIACLVLAALLAGATGRKRSIERGEQKRC